MDINEIVKEITNSIENYDNKDNKTWGEVYDSELNKYAGLTSKEKSLVLVRVVREISYHGYSIEDNPFRLEKF